jgi:arginyl-tRNA synthetase
VIEKIQKEKDEYGNNKSGNKEKVMIEYSNVNTHKQYHVGHLRNICYGDSVNKILKANGNKAIPVSYVNDFGIHVAKTLWWLYHEDNVRAKKITDSKEFEKKGYFLGETYVESSKKIKEYKNAKTEISKLMKSIETRKGKEYEKWKKTRTWSINEFKKIYKDLDVKFDEYFYESEYIEEGLKILKELLEKGILEESDGAIIANLEKYNLGVLVILRTDGTATYPVADLALANAKIKKYKLDKSIYVVDDRQSLYFRQLFKILELMGYKQNMVHLGHDFVKLPSGMMSSRSGNVITYKELKDKILNYLKEETKKRHSDWSEKKIEKTVLFILPP